MPNQPSNIAHLKYRYHSEAQFHTLVRALKHVLETTTLTTDDLHQSANMAAYLKDVVDIAFSTNVALPEQVIEPTVNHDSPKR